MQTKPLKTKSKQKKRKSKTTKKTKKTPNQSKRKTEKGGKELLCRILDKSTCCVEKV